METYHAHIYFDASTLELAEQIRLTLIQAIPELSYIGKLIHVAIGPHPQPMFEIHIPARILPSALSIIESIRSNLSVLIHPVVSNELEAHTTEAYWLGTVLPLKLDVLRSHTNQQ